MKLKYFLAAFIAISSFALTTVSCDDDDEKSFLSEVQVSSSYVTFPATGGSETIEVKASGAWSFTEVPAWLTVSPASGNGNATVTFTAAETAKTNECTVLLNCDGKTQRINVLQMTEKTELALSSCADVLAGLDGTAFRVGGVVTKIAESATYGNFYINDGTGEVYIYGTKYQGQTKQGAILKLGIEVGDEVIVEGPKTTYGGTVELVDVDVITVNKSLIKVDSTYVADVKTNELPLEGGVLTAYIACKGNGVSVDIPEAAQSWLSVIGVSNSTVKFRAAANEGGDRSVTVVLKTTDGKKEYTSQLAIAQKGAIVACSVAEFLAAEEGDAQFRLTAAVTSVDGKNVYVRDFSGDVLVYNPALDGKEIKMGDIITVVGKRSSYKNNPQMGSPVVEEVTPVTAIGLADFKALEDDKNTLYLISGVVSQPTEPNTKFDLETYGNFSLVDAEGTELYVYGVSTGVGGESKQFASLGVEQGDILTIIAYKTSYTKNDYTLMQAGGAMYFSHKNPE